MQNESSTEFSPKWDETSIPAKVIKRNDFGLIGDGSVKYIYDDKGFIDWRKMLNPKYVVPNRENFKKQNKPVPQTIENLEDKDLMILLQGVKELASVRGFNSVQYKVKVNDANYVIAVCTISFIPNFETENRAITFSGIGDASIFNTNSFGKNFLGPIAENRAFVRAVRNFLKINIVSQEEMNGNSNTSESETLDHRANLLKEVMEANNITFEKIKAKMIEEKYEGAENWKEISDIPATQQFVLIARIKEKASAAKKG